MAANNSTNYIPKASFGVEIDGAGRITPFALGKIDPRTAEQVAGKLLQLVYAIRAEARETRC